MILFNTKRLTARLFSIYSIYSYSRTCQVHNGQILTACDLCINFIPRQRQYEQLIMQAGGMKSKDFAEQWCKLMGEDARKQLDMFGLGMFADSAMPMCKCITATVKDIGKTSLKHLNRAQWDIW